jgi:hypothetical protein
MFQPSPHRPQWLINFLVPLCNRLGRSSPVAYHRQWQGAKGARPGDRSSLVHERVWMTVRSDLTLSPIRRNLSGDSGTMLVPMQPYGFHWHTPWRACHCFAHMPYIGEKTAIDLPSYGSKLD